MLRGVLGTAWVGRWAGLSLLLAAAGCDALTASLDVVLFRDVDAGATGPTAPGQPDVPTTPDAASQPVAATTGGPAAGSGGAAGEPGKPGMPIIRRPLPPDAKPFVRDDSGQSGLSREEVERLRQGDGPCRVGIAYPSEGTVFPVGLSPPTIMWPAPADKLQTGALVHLHYATNAVDYTFAVSGEQPGEMRVPDDAWREISARTDQRPLTVELSIGFEDEVQRCRTSLRIARGAMTGSLFYYQSSRDVAESFGVGGVPEGAQMGIYRLRLGTGVAEPFITQQGSNCVGCHAMNARGTKLISMTADFHSENISVTDNYYVYDIASGTPERAGKLDNTNFGAVTPDGRYVLSVGTPDCTQDEIYDVPPNRGVWFVDGPAVAKLQDTETGATVETKGLQPDWYMWMPQFSPDGRMVVFNHAKPDPDREGSVDRRELAVMDYDAATQTFSNLRVIASHLGPEPTGAYDMSTQVLGLLHRSGRDGCSAPLGQALTSGKYDRGVCEGPCYPAWPAFTPDNRGVVFSLVDQPDFNHSAGRKQPAKSYLYYVEIATGRVVRLDNAMRVADLDEYGYDNYPSVLPVSVGGYAWLFWTGRRSWGTHGGGIFQPGPMGELPGLAGSSSSRRIWVSALRLTDATRGDAMTDPSSPAFFLEGQGDRPSMRVSAALDACRAEGSSCDTGVDCCGGYCSAGECHVPEAPVCSKSMDACVSAADCCQEGTGQACIGGFCDVIVLQ
jgi:hypothetical protein